METIKGVSAIIYDKNSDHYFLILKRIKDWQGWEFCKGSIHPGEKSLDAVKREIKEETGISKFKIVGKLKKKRIFENSGKQHEIEVYLAETNMNTPVHIQHKDEHSTYLWSASAGVEGKLQWDNEKEVFRDALRYLKSKV